ncbi:MAG: aldehyde ferredoxin oxidoreductase C-terminal domain-containing protein, partial [Candidatus Bathyarchaeia archaeon]
FLTEERDKQFFHDRVLSITGTLKSTIPTEYEHKAKAVVWMEHENITNDLVGICKWVCVWNLLMPLSSKEHSELLSACTGLGIDRTILLRAAERVRNVERVFDAKEGLTRKDDTLPRRYFEEPLPDGRYKGELIDKVKFEKMKDEYYQLKGWSVETGLPTEKKLEELNLKDVADDLRKLKH